MFVGIGLFLLLVQGVCAGETPWKVGVWVERGPATDTSRSRTWADSLVRDLSRRTGAPAKLERFVLVRPGALPLAGGDPHYHPDLRDTVVDFAWGVPYGEALDRRMASRAERVWFSALGCADERNFAVGWDLFLLPKDPSNQPDTSLWRLDAHNFVRYPTWSELPDTGMDPFCRRVFGIARPGRGLRHFSLDTLRARLEQLLPSRLVVTVSDAGGRTAEGATLELWRSQPDSRRTFGARLEGPPRIFLSDSIGSFPLPTGVSWFTPEALVFGAQGSNALTYWRVKSGRRKLEGWMDATDLARLSDDSGQARLAWTLPGGSSGAWREASSKWPHGWLAAEADSSKTVFLGLSIPEDGLYVLRFLDQRGHEFLRAKPVHLSRGVHERTLSPGLPDGWWDVRLDGASDRWEVRMYQPPRRPAVP